MQRVVITSGPNLIGLAGSHLDRNRVTMIHKPHESHIQLWEESGRGAEDNGV